MSRQPFPCDLGSSRMVHVNWLHLHCWADGFVGLGEWLSRNVSRFPEHLRFETAEFETVLLFFETISLFFVEVSHFYFDLLEVEVLDKI